MNKGGWEAVCQGEGRRLQEGLSSLAHLAEDPAQEVMQKLWTVFCGAFPLKPAHCSSQCACVCCNARLPMHS